MAFLRMSHTGAVESQPMLPIAACRSRDIGVDGVPLELCECASSFGSRILSRSVSESMLRVVANGVVGRLESEQASLVSSFSPVTTVIEY